MSLSISKLLDLSNNNDKRKEKLGINPDIPERYSTLKKFGGIQGTSDKNFDHSNFDKFSEIMRQDRYKRYNATNLFLDVRSKRGTQLPNYDLEGWIDPAQRRRYVDAIHAPPPDLSVGTERQEFATGKDEEVEFDNTSLVQMAHRNYNKYINRYNIPTIPVSVQK